MNKHTIIKCSECYKVITQCRCLGPKEIEYRKCQECLNKVKEKSQCCENCGFNSARGQDSGCNGCLCHSPKTIDLMKEVSDKWDNQAEKLHEDIDFPSPNSWEEEFDEKFGDTDVYPNDLIPKNDVMATIIHIKSFISKTVEEARKESYKLGYEHGKNN